MKQINQEYPIGARVRLAGDYPDEDPREISGHMQMYGFNYLVFTDGYMALTERVERLVEGKGKYGKNGM